jgi:hypothetical protein
MFRLLQSRHARALLVIALPSIVWLAPMLRDPFHRVIGWEGDNLYYVRQFWWMKHALLDLHRLPFFDPSSYFPLGYSMSRGELTPANTLTALPVTIVAGPIAAYNLMVVVAFLTTGWATYAWTYRLTGSSAGAIVAGVIASMAPYRLAHAAGHLPLVATQGFPLTLWTFEELIAGDLARPRTSRWAVALGLSLAFTALCSWYYAYSLALMFSLYVALRVAPQHDLRFAPRFWGDIVLAAGIAIALVAVFLVPYLRASMAGTLRRTFAETDSWSLNFYDFIIPNAGHPLWSGWMSFAFPHEWGQWVERAVTLGYVALALALTTVIWRRRVAPAPIGALVGVAAVSALLALGLLLHSGDRRVALPMPYLVTKTADWLFFRIRPYSPLRTISWTQQVTFVPLPALFLFLFVPGTGGMRSFARFGYWTLLMIAALAAYGVREIVRRSSPGMAAVVTAALVVAVAFESWTSRVTTSLSERPVDRWVAQQPANDAIVELPLAEALRPAQDYYVTVHQHPTVFGPIGDSFAPNALQERATALANPSDAAAGFLRAWGTSIVLLHDDSPAGKEWRTILLRAGASEATRFDHVQAFRLFGAR